MPLLSQPHALFDLIAANSGPGGLDLQGADLSDRDFSAAALLELAVARGYTTGDPPIWLTERFATAGLNLIGVNFEGATLVRTNLSYARMQLATLRSVDCYGANLEGVDLYRADLSGASLYKANLRAAKLERSSLANADLRFADLRGANLLRANLSGALLARDSIGTALLQENRDSYAAYLDDDRRIDDFGLAITAAPTEQRRHLYPLFGIDWQFSADETEIREFHIALRLIEAQEIYRSLRVTFADQGRLDDTNWAYLHERRAQRRSYFFLNCHESYPLAYSRDVGRWTPLRSVTTTALFLAKWLRELLFGAVGGYGVRPFRSFAAIWVVTVLFAAGFWMAGDLGQGAGHPSFADSIVFSLSNIVTLGTVRVKPGDASTALFATLEAAMGISLFALFMFTLGNRISGR